MIAYLDKKEGKEELVFAQIIGDRDLIRRKIDDLNYGTVIDKFALKNYISKGMLLSYSDYNEAMFCNPDDILENLPTNSDRLMLLLDIMSFMKIKEINRITYNKDANYNEKFINLINWNTEILDMDKFININQNNFDEENVMPTEAREDKVKKLELIKG